MCNKYANLSPLPAGPMPTVAPVGRSYGKLTPGHQEAIYRLKKEGRSGREVRLKLAAGIDGEPPVSVSADRCNKVARRMMEERDELYTSAILTKPAPEGLRILTRRLMILAERETMRLERAERAGRLDANKLGKLAGALVKLHGLLERNAELYDPGEGSSAGEGGAAKKGDSPDGQAGPSPFAASLAARAAEPAPPEDGSAPTPGDAAPIADQVVKPTPAGAQNGAAHAVPDDPPSLGEGQGASPDVRTQPAAAEV